MRGQVLGVDLRTGDGMVAGDDGRRYAFRPADWAARGEPAVGMHVDFEIKENRALSIFPVPGTMPSPVPWALIDMVRYLVMSNGDFAARYARS